MFSLRRKMTSGWNPSALSSALSGFERPAGITCRPIQESTRIFSASVARLSRSAGGTMIASLREKKITVNSCGGASASSDRASSSSTIGSDRIMEPDASITYTMRRAFVLDRPTKVAVARVGSGAKRARDDSLVAPENRTRGSSSTGSSTRSTWGSGSVTSTRSCTRRSARPASSWDIRTSG